MVVPLPDDGGLTDEIAELAVLVVLTMLVMFALPTTGPTPPRAFGDSLLPLLADSDLWVGKDALRERGGPTTTFSRFGQISVGATGTDTLVPPPPPPVMVGA